MSPYQRVSQSSDAGQYEEEGDYDLKKDISF